MYVFSREALLSALRALGRKGGGFDLVRDVLMHLIPGGRVCGYRFDEYWEDVGTVPSYYRAHMDLLRTECQLTVFDPLWPIHTHGPQLQPPKFLPSARVRASFASQGCVVEGDVEDSVLCPGVRVERGARVRRSILMAGSRIRKGAVVETAIVDEGVRVEAGAHPAPGEPPHGIRVLCDGEEA